LFLAAKKAVLFRFAEKGRAVVLLGTGYDRGIRIFGFGKHG
jgi:hypothetical protein